MLDWQVGESEDWDSFEAVERPARAEPVVSDEAEPGRRWDWRSILRGAVVVITLTAIVMGYNAWREYQAGITQVRTDVQSTIDSEAWAWGNADADLLDSLMDRQADDGWGRDFRREIERELHYAGNGVQTPQVQIENVELANDVALIEVLVTDPGVPWTATPYRETRFYRQVGERWLRTEPVAEFWGPEDILQTDHFHFQFHQRDAGAVKAVAENVDALYAGLREDVGLGPAPAGETLTIRVRPRTDVTDWRFAGDTLTVPSPALLPVPEDRTAVDRLSQSIVYPLAQHVLQEALEDVDVEREWSTVIEGIRHWLTWDRWALPSGWRYHAEEPLRQQVEYGKMLRLEDVTPRWREGWDRTHRWTRLIVAETVVAYATETYGRDRLPALLQGLSQHESWRRLIPAVFDVSADEFEAGWQVYLTTRYDQATERTTAQTESRLSDEQ